MTKKIFFYFIFSILGACTEKKTDFGKFDFVTWKSDPKGCQNKRKTQFNEFKGIKEKLKGLSQNQIIQYFGRPDAQILDDRNKKYYIYYFESGEQCNQRITKQTLAQSVAFHFSAISLVTEVTFQMGNP